MKKDDAIRVEVVYALPQRQHVVTVTLAHGASVQDAVQASGLAQQFPDANLPRLPAGIFGRRAAPDTPLRDGDRVELYRALSRDPKQARRELARAGRSMGRTRRE